MTSRTAMDGADLTFDAGPNHRAYPDLPCTTLNGVLAGNATGRRP